MIALAEYPSKERRKNDGFEEWSKEEVDEIEKESEVDTNGKTDIDVL